jgi:hypothetical protein
VTSQYICCEGVTRVPKTSYGGEGTFFPAHLQIKLVKCPCCGSEHVTFTMTVKRKLPLPYAGKVKMCIVWLLVKMLNVRCRD